MNPGSSVDKIVAEIENSYRERTHRSAVLFEKAVQVMPGGNTRQSIAFKPYPLFLESGKGFSLYDCDGNAYIDFMGNYTSLIHGHCDPDVTAAVREQVEKGTPLGCLAEKQITHAGMLKQRIPSVEMVRYTNSGTEATMFAIRTARAVTRKDKIIKFEGGYHGTHDAAKVSLIPDFNPQDRVPKARLEGLGVPQGILNDVIVAPFNNLEITERLLKQHHPHTACIIVEPFLGSMGIVSAEPGFLKGLRELADRYGVLLIFDEVQSFRMSTGGMQLLENVQPDITALGKVIGGGYPVGAFGGREDIMRRFGKDIMAPDAISHSGTFNGNEVTMAAGIAAVEKLDQSAIDRINGLGRRLRNDLNHYFASSGIKCVVQGVGSLSSLTYAEKKATDAFEWVSALLPCLELQRLVHLELLNQGVFAISRGEFVISTPMTEKEVSVCIDRVKGAFERLMPYIKEKIPSLLR
jgi:glutamate-1-semialdehyde 2,1-aminomutase